MPIWEARTEIYRVKIEVYPRLKWAILTPLWLNGRFMTNGNGAEVTGCGTQREFMGAVTFRLSLARLTSTLSSIPTVPKRTWTYWGLYILYLMFRSFYRHRLMELLFLFNVN